MKKENINFILFSFICGLSLLGSVYVYAEMGTDYVVDEAQIDCLFASEQEILNVYSMNTIETEDIVSDLNQKGDNEIEILEIVNDVSILSDTEIIDDSVELEDDILPMVEVSSDVKYSDINIDNTENLTFLSVSNMKIIECEEEYYANNRLSSRDLTSEVGSKDETHEEKLFRVFGEDYLEMDGRVDYYPGGEEEALLDMETFNIVVWDLDENGEWYQRNQRLTSHKTLVKTLKCIFSDLLELPEEDRVPIKLIGCYNYRAGSSAHTCGAALDINWPENAEMTNSGRITAGYYWKPGEDIYSIKSNSPFVETFEKYGWTWGGYWTSKKDYMHFSYLDR